MPTTKSQQRAADKRAARTLKSKRARGIRKHDEQLQREAVNVQALDFLHAYQTKHPGREQELLDYLKANKKRGGSR